MFDLLWLIPGLPLAGFLLAPAAGRRWAGVVGTASVGLSALLVLVLGALLLARPGSGEGVRRGLWTWIDAGGLEVALSLRFDGLSLVMGGVVTGVGFLIHLYSLGYMAGEEGRARFFSWMNLFVGSMLILVLADSLLLLYLGWEGVGLCSYLLIGFWYRDPANGRAARKAFVVTRLGDCALALGIFLLFAEFGTLHIPEVLGRAGETWSPGSGPALAAALLLLGGALGKSAQLPLQTWLPDAMAGPTPVSALIHAATMVTAGVYLVARLHPLFLLAPPAMTCLAVLGAATLLVAGLSALAQRDLKRILAYSTISQIGYMFLALGAGAWSAAIFHLVTHAFFKALLFLAAGVVILRLHHEQDIFRMGGLRRKLPLVFWTFLAGAASLAALPLVTAGFYSKDVVLWRVYASPTAGPWLWAAGLAGAFLTSLYTFRMVFRVFCGGARAEPERQGGGVMVPPLLVLALLSLAGGLVETPANLGGISLFGAVTAPVLAAPPPATAGHDTELLLQLLAAGAALGGLLVAWGAWRRAPAGEGMGAAGGSAGWARRFLLAGFGFDRLYELVLVRPFLGMARLLQDDLIDRLQRPVASFFLLLHHLLRLTQNGRLRYYAYGIAGGAAAALALAVCR